ncbi:MAG: hypothetical protein J3K34DRAFT_402368 [Monoraphidium minutum]|nr:MAG: hypothetical protein J3K34DRAFT_402368 [Monoraphidium minutum]
MSGAVFSCTAPRSFTPRHLKPCMSHRFHHTSLHAAAAARLLPPWACTICVLRTSLFHRCTAHGAAPVWRRHDCAGSEGSCSFGAPPTGPLSCACGLPAPHRRWRARVWMRQVLLERSRVWGALSFGAQGSDRSLHHTSLCWALWGDRCAPVDAHENTQQHDISVTLGVVLYRV